MGSGGWGGGWGWGGRCERGEVEAKGSMDALLMTGTAALTAQLLSMTLQETNEHCTMSARQQTFITKSLGIALALHGTLPSRSQPKRREKTLRELPLSVSCI